MIVTTGIDTPISEKDQDDKRSKKPADGSIL